jgi:hypothetical protein
MSNKSNSTGAVVLTYPTSENGFTVNEVLAVNSGTNRSTVVLRMTKDTEKGVLVKLSDTRKTGGKGKPASLFKVNQNQTIPASVEGAVNTNPIPDAVTV